jgi:hypothetical protein
MQYPTAVNKNKFWSDLDTNIRSADCEESGDHALMNTYSFQFNPSTAKNVSLKLTVSHNCQIITNHNLI